jgi:hypothetical protein
MTTTNRRDVRKAIRLPVSIGGKQAALSADVSPRGFQLETTTLLPQGLPVEGYVLHGDKELKWKGVVAWSRAGNPMMSTWHAMGVQFTEVSPGLRALISMRSRG